MTLLFETFLLLLLRRLRGPAFVFCFSVFCLGCFLCGSHCCSKRFWSFCWVLLWARFCFLISVFCLGCVPLRATWLFETFLLLPLLLRPLRGPTFSFPSRCFVSVGFLCGRHCCLKRSCTSCCNHFPLLVCRLGVLSRLVSSVGNNAA